MEIRSRKSTSNEVEPVKEISIIDIATMRIAVSSYVEDVILSSLVSSLSQVAELVQGEQRADEKGSISVRVDIVYPTELSLRQDYIYRSSGTKEEYSIKLSSLPHCIDGSKAAEGMSYYAATSVRLGGFHNGLRSSIYCCIEVSEQSPHSRILHIDHVSAVVRYEAIENLVREGILRVEGVPDTIDAEDFAHACFPFSFFYLTL
jgi:hypothetical protein